MLTLIDFPAGDDGRLRGRFEAPLEVLAALHLDEVVPVIEAAEAHAKRGRWAAGMLAYEAAPAFDPAFVTASPAPNLPLAAFAVFEGNPGSFDPPRQMPAGSFSCTPWRHDTAYAAFERTVEAIRDRIAAGGYYQANFTTRLTAGFTGDAEAFFHALCAAQPGCYALFLDFDGWQAASVSPELFFAWDPRTGEIETRPMKGTAPREAGAEALRASAKDRAENLMIADLLRNDISRVADDVRVSDLFAVEALPTALQMTSTVIGTTRPEIRLADVFRALFPCGSVTGAPKIAAMKAIAGHETSPRGAYCGALGMIRPGGKAIFSVGIRTVTIAGAEAVCGVGSGITSDSRSQEEFAEGRVKQRFLWRASANFQLLETLRLESGAYWLLQRHVDRMRRGAAYFGFAFDETRVREALRAAGEANRQGLSRVRLLMDRGGAVKAEAFAFEEEFPALKSLQSARAREIAKLAELAARPISSDGEFLRHKTTHRAVYEEFAPSSPGIFDTLLYNERGEITEFTRGNAIAELDGRLVTPPESCCLLPGTLRDELLAQGEVFEQVFTLDDVRRATALWFVNSLRGIIPVRLKN